MREVLGAWAFFTITDLAVQEVLRILLSSAVSARADLAVWAMEHALLLQALIAAVGAAVACLPYLGRIRWETGFPDRPFTGIASNRTVLLILSGLSGILAEHQIGIFAVSTYNTDYILVKEENFERALEVLTAAGYGCAQ